MNRSVTFAVAGALAALLLVPAVSAAPRPKVVPTDWELKIVMKDPKPIQVSVPGETRKETYWYVLYTVTNRTGADRVFIPSFSLYTDTGQVLAAGSGVSVSAFGAIQARHNNPLLKNALSMTGKLLQGADNAKDGVAIFRDIDGKSRAFDLFVGGISGESVRAKLPVKVVVEKSDMTGKRVKVATDMILLQKTLHLSFKLPGEAAARTSGTPKLLKRTWIMR